MPTYAPTPVNTASQSQQPSGPFRLLLCGDLGGTKLNIEPIFDRKPEAVSKIADEGQNLFNAELNKRNLDGRFTVDFVVFYDDAIRKWRPLETTVQLVEFMQLYLFQQGSSEAVREIPPPTMQAMASGTASRTVHKPGVSVVDTEKVEWLFRELDINENDVIEPDEFLFGFATAGIDFNDETVMRLFEKSDTNADALLGWEEFQVFAELFPNTVETLYWRLRAVEADPSNKSGAALLRKHRRHMNDLRKQLEDAERERQQLERKVRQEHMMARELDPRRRVLEDEEQDLVNKEFALQFHRDLVVQAESQFAETATRFDHASAVQGSPRRARFL